MIRIKNLLGRAALVSMLCAGAMYAGEEENKTQTTEKSWYDLDNIKDKAGNIFTSIKENMFVNNGSLDLNHAAGLVCGATALSSPITSIAAAALSVVAMPYIKDALFSTQELAKLVQQFTKLNQTAKNKEINEILRRAAANYKDESAGKIVDQKKIETAAELINAIKAVDGVKNKSQNVASITQAIETYEKERADWQQRLYRILAGGAVGLAGSAAISVVSQVF